MSNDRKVIMLGLDAADCDVVLDLVNQGQLPNLERLINNGTFGRLSTSASHYAGGVWPSFYTGQSVPWHGIFHNKQWRPEAMQVEVPSDQWIASRPFWEALGEAGMPLCIVDVPMVLGKPRPVNGAYLAGWGTHDLICKGSWPTHLWQDLEHRFGAPRMPREHFGRQTPESLRHLTQQLLQTTNQMRDISIEMLGKNTWQFACVVLGAIHRAGHYLWDLSQLEGSDPTGPDSLEIASALTRIYTNTDAALGDIVKTLPKDALVVVFAVHGMGPNAGWSDLLPDILTKIETRRSGRMPKQGLIYSLKQRMPYHLVRPLLTRLPDAVTDGLVKMWSRRMFDWAATRYFPIPMDEAGYLRINLRGREALGIVEPGEEYDALCCQIEKLLMGLYDPATGTPIAAKIERSYQNADAAAPYRLLIPDLIVTWQSVTAATTQRLMSNDFPDFVYEVPQHLPSGRSGNHTEKAWFVAHGAGMPCARLDDTHSVLDLLPTILNYLDIAPATDLPGQVIELGAAQ